MQELVDVKLHPPNEKQEIVSSSKFDVPILEDSTIEEGEKRPSNEG